MWNSPAGILPVEQEKVIDWQHRVWKWTYIPPTWVGKKVQWVKKLAAKTKDLSLIPGPHMVEEEWLLQLSFDLHPCYSVAYVLPSPITTLHT